MTATSNKIRVLLAEDQTMLRGALAALLELEPDITVIAQAANGREAFKLARDLTRASDLALELARDVGHQAALAEWRAEEIYPRTDCRSDADLDAFVRRAVMTHHHPVGTCRMGHEESSVVDADLSLRGFEQLYIVDASVIPTITSGPIHAAVLAIAETFAADILAPRLGR